ncbi:hypothetical protein G9A89_003146 [Geosiphon pyriformis]|nr:hypothetical protein G9A89_003146 [Geosiphon pyriformis]
MKQKNHYSDQPDFYDRAPSLSIARELLLALKEDLVEELIILTAAMKGRYPNDGGNPKKIKKIEETFGHFPQCKLKFIPTVKENDGYFPLRWV